MANSAEMSKLQVQHVFIAPFVRREGIIQATWIHFTSLEEENPRLVF